MKILRCTNWVFAAMTWSLAALCGLSNLMSWESAWTISGMCWPLTAQMSALVSISTLISAFAEDDRAEKKACVLSGLITLVVSLLVSVLMNCVFTTWFGFGELSGTC